MLFKAKNKNIKIGFGSGYLIKKITLKNLPMRIILIL